MGVHKSEIVTILKSKGLRITPQRFAVYVNLRSRGDHPTAEQILTDLNREIFTSSQATVYSALQTLREVNLIREVLLQEGVSRYDANVSPHHHFHCRQCEKIEDVDWYAFQSINLNSLRAGLTVDSYEITVQGLCENCQ
ncbi:MAG: Fur family transcriptional regulator [cyanobacterium endosymbiont of Rhopalodia musculus]|uniref:Fur family transcriptional regulator n=1 Tax=cyanobacterium endosymbiont of Epithemia clementina EcSB TaxID=3034674 RepID=UPI00248087EE|nr:Fur family transcriptional regulator [cyanobacterium endosymbiont of Epithemia clementina EcSB]WGT67156.1 Fur family transcriptional regulator [cyanobacterium endosymbiont of Epithemia clementina EcSB]